MYSMPHPDSNGTPSRGESAPAMKSGGGEVNLSAAEAAALAALETDGDDYKRAMRDSGLNSNQIRTLKVRAQKMRSKGYTLRGASHVFKAHTSQEPESHGLIGSATKAGEPQKTAAAKGTPKKAREVALDEAVDARRAAVQRALDSWRTARTQLTGPGEVSSVPYYYVEPGTLELDSFVVTESVGVGRKYLKVTYALDRDGVATLGSWTEVERAWVPKKKLSQK